MLKLPLLYKMVLVEFSSGLLAIKANSLAESKAKPAAAGRFHLPGVKSNTVRT
jgi:hypothetical protein